MQAVSHKRGRNCRAKLINVGFVGGRNISVLAAVTQYHIVMCRGRRIGELDVHGTVVSSRPDRRDGCPGTRHQPGSTTQPWAILTVWKAMTQSSKKSRHTLGNCLRSALEWTRRLRATPRSRLQLGFCSRPHTAGKFGEN